MGEMLCVKGALFNAYLMPSQGEGSKDRKGSFLPSCCSGNKCWRLSSSMELAHWAEEILFSTVRQVF